MTSIWPNSSNVKWLYWGQVEVNLWMMVTYPSISFNSAWNWNIQQWYSACSSIFLWQAIVVIFFALRFHSLKYSLSFYTQKGFVPENWPVLKVNALWQILRRWCWRTSVQKRTAIWWQTDGPAKTVSQKLDVHYFQRSFTFRHFDRPVSLQPFETYF